MHRVARRESRVSLRATAGEGESHPLVLFICVHNAGRSRMAEAFLDKLAGDRYTAVSAGSEPAAAPHPEVVAAMEEVGVPLRPGPGRMLSPEMASMAAAVVSMGCGMEEACPALVIPAEDWDLPDPKGKSPEEVAAIRDRIEMNVRNLVARLDRATASSAP